jgi:hypothetical protein
MAGERYELGAVRCTICGHGIAKRAELVLRGADVMHVTCDATPVAPETRARDRDPRTSAC